MTPLIKDLGDQEDAIFKEIEEEEIIYFEKMFKAFKCVLLEEQKFNKRQDAVQEIFIKLDINEVPSNIKSDDNDDEDVIIEEEHPCEIDEESDLQRNEEVIDKEEEVLKSSVTLCLTKHFNSPCCVQIVGLNRCIR